MEYEIIRDRVSMGKFESQELEEEIRNGTFYGTDLWVEHSEHAPAGRMENFPYYKEWRDGLPSRIKASNAIQAAWLIMIVLAVGSTIWAYKYKIDSVWLCLPWALLIGGTAFGISEKPERHPIKQGGIAFLALCVIPPTLFVPFYGVIFLFQYLSNPSHYAPTAMLTNAPLLGTVILFCLAMWHSYRVELDKHEESERSLKLHNKQRFMRQEDEWKQKVSVLQRRVRELETAERKRYETIS